METSRDNFLREVNQYVEEFFAEFGYPGDLVKRTKEMIEYQIPSETQAITWSCVLKISKILKPNLSADELKMADTLGWISIMLEAFITCHDDYFDLGSRRNGKVTWTHLQNHSKSVIVHDASLLKAIAFYIIKRKFSHKSQIHSKLVEVFCYKDDLSLKCCFLESHYLVQNVRDGKKSLESYNMETYYLMARLKATGFFISPVELAMIVTGFHIETKSELYQNIKTVCSEFGILATVCDDYFDCYSPSPCVASSDSDIARGQFTWLFVIAKEKCTDQIQSVLKHYGRDDDESVAFIKALYEKIDIHGLFKEFCKQNFDKTLKQIDNFFVNDNTIHELMTSYISYLSKVYTDGAFGTLE